MDSDINDRDEFSPSRRQVLAGVGGVGLLTAASHIHGRQRGHVRLPGSADGQDGTPEQIHLTWGSDPARSVVVSWASPGPAIAARVALTRADDGHHRDHGRARIVKAAERAYTDGLNGQTVWTYHAELDELRPDTSYSYVVTADNDGAATPFNGTFRTAPAGRAPFRFTSFGDLATPNTAWVLSYGQSAFAVAAVESFKPLFHLLNSTRSGPTRSTRQPASRALQRRTTPSSRPSR